MAYPTNLVNFNVNFKFVNLKSELFLFSALADIPTQEWKNRNYSADISWAGKALGPDQEFIQMVVNKVKNTFSTTNDETCSISLETLLSPPSGCCLSPQIRHLTIIAQLLYRSYGIEIKQVDDMQSPKNMTVSWHLDHPLLNPPSPYLIKSRKEGFRTDCTLKFGAKLFPVHGTVLAARSPYFEKMFKNSAYPEAQLGAVIPVIMEGVAENSFEVLLDYFYTGKLDLKNASIQHIDDLVNFSSYFALPHLEQICIVHLCSSVNADNLKEYITLARHYQHEELESALIEHVQKEVTPDNLESLFLFATTEKIEGLSEICITGIEKQIQKIDYEPCGFGGSIHLEEFKKFLDVSIKCKSSSTLFAIIAQMRETLSHPGYGTHLEKLIEYLALVCEYQPRFDWLSIKSTNDIHTMKDELYQEVIGSLKQRDTELYESHFSWHLMAECLSVAKAYQFEDITNICLPVLCKQIQKNLEDPQLFDLVKGCLEISAEFRHPELRNTCENVLLIKMSTSFDSYNKILSLANQFNLTRVKEKCENLKQ